VDDGLAHDRAETRHALAEPPRHAAAMQWKIGASSPSSHR
jgi:hypothetical protein